MIFDLIEILLPLMLAFIVPQLRFDCKSLINNASYLFEILIIYTAIGGVLGLYLNFLVFDIIGHQFNIYSIVFGLTSTSLLIFAYKTRLTKWFFLLDLGLWFFILTIKGGYMVGFGIGLPYPSIILFDAVSTLIRLQLFRKIIFDFKVIYIFILTLAILTIKTVFLGYPLIDMIIHNHP